MDEVAVFLSSLVSHLTTECPTDLVGGSYEDAHGGGGGMPLFL